eukprot:366391-Chlamydomonas_euryale.AAC.29
MGVPARRLQRGVDGAPHRAVGRGKVLQDVDWPALAAPRRFDLAWLQLQGYAFGRAICTLWHATMRTCMPTIKLRAAARPTSENLFPVLTRRTSPSSRASPPLRSHGMACGKAGSATQASQWTYACTDVSKELGHAHMPPAGTCDLMHHPHSHTLPCTRLSAQIPPYSCFLPASPGAAAPSSPLTYHTHRCCGYKYNSVSRS